MLESLPLMKLAVMVAIGPGFINVFSDSPNAIATAIGARFLSPSLPLSWRLFAICWGNYRGNIWSIPCQEYRQRIAM
jgi:phosphate/sulfate permease